jgi:hypothetical protein
MHRIVCAFIATIALASAACSQQISSTESKLIGNWSMPRRSGLADDSFTRANRGFDITTFKTDHTFSQTAHPTQAPPAHVLSGNWRFDGNELVVKFTWAHPTMQDMVGQELRLVISDLQADKFASTDAQNQKQKIVWTRVK